MDLDYDNKPGKKIVPRVYYPKCRCGERASPGFKTCQECRLYQRTRIKLYRQGKKEAKKSEG